MEVIHQRIILNKELLDAANRGDETSFSGLLGLGDNDVQGQQTVINIGRSNGRHAPKNPIAMINEPDFFLGATPAGNSLLHIAANSDFLEAAKKLLRRESFLLVTRNKKGETPLHCAVSIGSHEMASHLIEFARGMGPGAVEEVMRAKNKDGETALHETARHGHADLAHLLITTDPVLASVVDDQGISPLYLATASGCLQVLQTMIRGLNGIEVFGASYAGPHGQTVLHAAVLRSIEMTEELLKWKPLLAQMPDKTGSTPLHFAASYGYDKVAEVLLKFDHSLAYLYDSCGSYPVHVAAKTGHGRVTRVIMNHCADSDELLDAKGRNFLHVAAKEGQIQVVRFICGTTMYRNRRMKNARDNDGNTPIHLALDSGHEMIIRQLMDDDEVSVNTFNKKGLTPRDQSAIATFNDTAISPKNQRVNFWIKKSMEMVGAYHGSSRWDQIIHEHTTIEDAEEENKKVAAAIQAIGLGSVLIATATFANLFSIPGGYRSYSDPKSGTPTLATKYAFKAFLLSDTIAFLFAFHSTIILLFRGVTSSNPDLKKKKVSIALSYIILASRYTVVSFALAIYVVLAPVYELFGVLAIVGAIIFQYDGTGRDYKLVARVLSRRRGWQQLLQDKLPEATLWTAMSAKSRYARSCIRYLVELVLPVVLGLVGPLLIEHAFDACKFVFKKLVHSWHFRNHLL